MKPSNRRTLLRFPSCIARLARVAGSSALLAIFLVTGLAHAQSFDGAQKDVDARLLEAIPGYTPGF